MTNQSAIDKLIEMRFNVMTDVFRAQLDAPAMKKMLFEDRMGIIVDIECNSRRRNELARLIKSAHFDQPEAAIVDIGYT